MKERRFFLKERRVFFRLVRAETAVLREQRVASIACLCSLSKAVSVLCSNLLEECTVIKNPVTKVFYKIDEAYK